MRVKPIRAEDVEGKRGQTFYPEPFKQTVAGRTKRKLGDFFGLASFGVNPGSRGQAALCAAAGAEL